jgi:hypothetical protein
LSASADGFPAGRADGTAAGVKTPRLALALSLGAILLFVLIITLPFANQAFHMDDGTFWDFAKVNLEHPFQQHIPDYHLLGVHVATFRDTHPAVDWLYLSTLMELTGSDSERTLHLGYIVFPLLAAISMFFLSRRFIKNPLFATLMFLATPAVMTASHTLMGDMPLMSLWLAATTVYIYGVDRNDLRLLALAGVTATLAVFAGYQALALIPLLPAYAWLKGRLSWRTALPLLAPSVAFGLFTLYNFVNYGGPPRFTHARGLSLAEKDLLDRFQGMFLQVGGASVFPLFMAALLSLRSRRYLLLPLVAAVTAVLGFFHYRDDGYTAASAILFTIFLTAAMMLLAVIAIEGFRQFQEVRRDRQYDSDFAFLSLWLLSIMIGVIVLLPHATAKYSLPFLAPLILLIFREAEARIASRSLFALVMTVAVFFTLATGVIVSAADYQLAETYKDYALSFDKSYPTQGTVWFVGEWGFRHYMESRGYRYLTSDNTAPAPGDLVVIPKLSNWPLADQVAGSMRLIGSTEVQGNLPVRVMNFEANAGLYGTYWGDLPYSLSKAPLERFEVYEIEGTRG